MKKLIIVVVVGLSLMGGSVLAQGEFLRPGESGFGVSGLKSLTDAVDAYGLSFGTSPGGYFDLSFAYSHNEEYEVNGYGPAFTYYIKNSQPKTLTGIGFTVGYTHLESDLSSGTADFLVLGISLFANLYASPVVAIQPSLSTAITVGLKEGSGNQNTITPAIAIIAAHREHLRPFIGLSYTANSDDSESNFASVSVGIVFQWAKERVDEW